MTRLPTEESVAYDDQTPGIFWAHSGPGCCVHRRLHLFGKTNPLIYYTYAFFAVATAITRYIDDTDSCGPGRDTTGARSRRAIIQQW